MAKSRETMLDLAVGVTIIAAVKFLFEGVTFYFGGHEVNLGHCDAATYGALLLPVLGAHGYMKVNGKDSKGVQDVLEQEGK